MVAGENQRGACQLVRRKGNPRAVDIQAGCDEKFGLMRGTVANWENGYAEPETELLPDIAGFFGVTIWALTNNLPLAG